MHCIKTHEYQILLKSVPLHVPW